MLEITYIFMPYVFLIILLSVIYGVYKKKYIVSIILFVGSIVLNNKYHCFALPHDFCENVINNTEIKVLSINAQLPKENATNKIDDISKIIIKENADFVFISEAYPPNSEKLYNILSKYYFHSNYDCGPNNILYSKYPIANYRRVLSNKQSYSSVMRYMVDYKSSKLVIYGCHLASNNRTLDGDLFYLSEIKNLRNFTSYINNLIFWIKQREFDAVDICTDMSKFQLPSIVLGDLNDTYGSPLFNVFMNKGKLSDSWYEGGLGFGFTIMNPVPMRIDHILYSSRLKLKCVKTIDLGSLSDHKGISASFILR